MFFFISYASADTHNDNNQESDLAHSSMCQTRDNETPTNTSGEVVGDIFAPTDYLSEGRCSTIHLTNEQDPLIDNLQEPALSLTKLFKISNDIPWSSDKYQDKLETILASPIALQRKWREDIAIGAIVSDQRYIITSDFLTRDVNNLKVQLNNNKIFDVTLMWNKPSLNLAIFKIKDIDEEERNLIPFSDISKNINYPKLGEEAWAISLDANHNKIVAKTMVSSSYLNNYNDYILLNDDLHLSYYGGILANKQGDIIGFNIPSTAKKGMMPRLQTTLKSTIVSTILKQLSSDGLLQLVWIGADYEDLTLQDLLDIEELNYGSGVEVKEVVENSPAQRAGLKVGDIIVAINDNPVSSRHDILSYERHLLVHEKIEFKLMDNRSIIFMCEPFSSEFNEDLFKVTQDSLWQGVIFANSSPKLNQIFNLPLKNKGVIIRNIPEGSLAAQFGFKEGDMVRYINDRNIKQTDDIRNINMRRGMRWEVVLERQENPFVLYISY